MKRQILISALSIMTAISMIPSLAFATTEEQATHGDATIVEMAKQMQDPEKDPFDYTSKTARKKALKAAKENYPDTFDLRDVGGKSYVTPVKFQNPFGTCWGFAAIAAAETSILGSGLAAQDNYDENTLDLSEKHLAYFLSQPISDPADPQYGEGTHVDKGVTLSERFDMGGLPFLATSLFASGVGPNLENIDKILEYRGRNGWTIKKTVDGKVVDYCYDDEDDWSIPEKWRFSQSYRLKESFMLPSPAKVNSDTKAYTYNPAGTAAIKEMLLNKRAVQIGFSADTSSPSQEAGDGKYISKNWAHYTYDADADANHAVTIVGWDDNYPASNFVKGHQPPKDMFPDGQRKGASNGGNGAWLVKNSWGSEERTFPNRGPGWGIEKNGVHTGYFWLSYYDKSISIPEALEFNKSNKGSNYIIDAHDYMPVNELDNVTLKSKLMSANVFKALECQTLDKVSCETTQPNTRVINEVYLLPNKFTRPTEGLLVDKVEATFDYGGFHTMDLKSPELIQKGQYYSIVQTQITAKNEYCLNFSIAFGKEFMKALGGNSWVQGVINPRESYLYYDGGWSDYSNESIKKKLFGEFYRVMTFDNFPIKGYCTPTNNNISLRVNGDTSLELNDKSNLSVIYKGDAGSDFDAPKVTWTLAKGGDKFFTLTPDPKRDDKVTIKAKDIGEALLYVTAEGIGTTVVRLSVAKKEINGVGFYREFVYTGKALKPKPVVDTEDGEVVPPSHYTLSYKDNKKCGEATVFVKVKPGDTRYTGDTEGWFTILPQKSVIRKMKAGKRKLTITVKGQKASGAKNYKVLYRIKGTRKWTTKTFKVAKGNKLVLNKLKKKKKYQVKVCATTPYGDEGKFSVMKTSKKIK